MSASSSPIRQPARGSSRVTRGSRSRSITSASRPASSTRPRASRSASRYRNLETVPLEVVYVFPLDEGAAVCGFEATVDGVRYVGRVKERDEAFREYDEAMEAGHGAFLLDEERADVFTASLGNMKPGASVELSITYVTELAAEGEGVRFTLPTTVSPRYAPEPTGQASARHPPRR